LLHQSEDMPMGNLLELLPAHDPFGLTKGASHAR
jgi:hypothetical protein